MKGMVVPVVKKKGSLIKNALYLCLHLFNMICLFNKHVDLHI